MLLPDFYKITETNFTDHKLQAVIELNAAHDVFKGHFPNNPVTPGVCMLQIFKELSEQTLQKKLSIKECSNVKFMALINPETHPILNIAIDISETDLGYKIKATALFDTTVALKASVLLTPDL